MQQPACAGRLMCASLLMYGMQLAGNDTVASHLHLSMDTCLHALAEQEANGGVGSCQDMHMACYPS